MDPADVLQTVAELAVAFAGFSGIVAALGPRSEGGLFPEDRVRLSVLIGASLSTAAFALLPLLLFEPVGVPGTVWKIASAVYLPYGLAVVVVGERQTRRARAEDPELVNRVSRLPMLLSTFVVFPLVLALQVANVALWGRFTPYLVALVWGLAGCAIGFAGLVRSLHRA